MKKVLLILLFSVLFVPSFAQKVYYKLKAGYNSSDIVINGYKFYNTEYGPNGGMTIVVPLKKNFLFQTGIIYSHKGDSYTSNYSSIPITQSISYKTSDILNYLVVPVLVGYSLKDKLHFFAGPQFAYLLSGSQKTKGVAAVTYPDYYRKSDFSMVGAVEYKAFKSFGLYGGYDYGLSKFMKSVVVSNGAVTGYTYIGGNRTVFIGLFYQGEIIMKR